MDDNLDFFGTNDGLLMHDASASDDALDSSDSEMEPAHPGIEASKLFHGLINLEVLCFMFLALRLCDTGGTVAEQFVFLKQDPADAALIPRQDQTSYIMSLEQENMALKQQNLDLQEVLDRHSLPIETAPAANHAATDSPCACDSEDGCVWC